MLFRAKKIEIQQRKKLVKKLYNQDITSPSMIKRTLKSKYKINAGKTSIHRDLQELKEKPIVVVKAKPQPKVVKTTTPQDKAGNPQLSHSMTIENPLITTPCGCGEYHQLTPQPNMSVDCMTCGQHYDRKNRKWVEYPRIYHTIWQH